MTDTATKVSVVWRVSYRRQAWGAGTRNKHKDFERFVAARAFAQRLLNGLPELSPVTHVRILKCARGPWQEAWQWERG